MTGARRATRIPPRPVMSPNFRIATRFLTAKKRAMLMSLACIVLGVGLFVVTQAITSGFEQFFIKTILGTDGAIRIEDKIQDTMRSMEAGGRGSGSNFHISMRGEGKKYIEGIDEPKLLMDSLRRFDNVAGVSEVLHAPVTIHSSFKSDSVQVYGFNLDDQLRVSDLGEQIAQGSLANFRTQYNGALLGRRWRTAWSSPWATPSSWKPGASRAATGSAPSMKPASRTSTGCGSISRWARPGRS